MSTSHPRADIIVVNYRSGEFLRGCMDAVRNQTESRFRVYLVDNSPETGEVAELGSLDDRFTILPQTENTGFARACNLGASRGTAPFIVMLNPDTLPKADWLANLLDCIESTDAAMAGSTQLMLADPSCLDGAGDAYMAIGVAWRGGFEKSVDNAPPTGTCFGPCAAASVYRRDVFEAVGGFDERFFCYMEDVDIAYRIRLRGGFGVQSREAVVAHFGSASSGRASPFVIYHGTRNRIWTFLKNTPPVLLVLMLPLNLLLNTAFLVRAIFHQRFWMTWKATQDGFAGWSWISPERRKLAKSRTRGSRAIASAVTWSPFKFLSRTPDVRPLPDAQRPK